MARRGRACSILVIITVIIVIPVARKVYLSYTVQYHSTSMSRNLRKKMALADLILLANYGAGLDLLALKG